MKYAIPVFILISLSTVGCQNQTKEINNDEQTSISNLKVDGNNSSSIQPDFPLPNYGEVYMIDENGNTRSDIVMEYEARNEGRLTIRNGCVTLTYPKDRYPTSTAADDFSSMPIFPGGSKFIENGQAIEVNDKIYRDGDYVWMSGRGTVRAFWTSYPLDMDYIPIPDHCVADEYWEVGGTGLRIMD
ncbi:hypothetical protein ES754_00850 [Psychrobacter frigidicola]|uniref:Uncharacterized protein n=1 Tax=Psychrobacter frigidicola TaxID=45611 RepID=A0A5C7A3B5_9GAMM|nr:hypothetical protein [Psychrobacter frigidicola]TXD97568.1 hypothetical protein ES754_00850 [Psychrobacter frigidicola]